jgi:hypothetical protein
VKEARDMVMKIVGVVDRGATDVKSCMKQAEAEHIKLLAKQGQQQTPKKKQKLDDGKKTKTRGAAFVLTSTRELDKFVSFATLEGFRKALADKSFDVDRSEPFLIENVPEMAAFMGDRSVKTIFGCFKCKFATEKAVIEDGRGMAPMRHDKKDKCLGLLLECAPNPGPAPAEKSPLNQMLTQVHFFGSLAGRFYTGVERQCMGAVRYQMSGEREVAIAHASDLLDFYDAENIDITEGAGENADIPELIASQFAKYIDSNEKIDAFIATRGDGSVKLYRGVVKPGQALCVPMGCIMSERTLGAQNVVGVRAPYLDCSSTALGSFIDLQILQADLGRKSTASAILCKFWEMIDAACGDKMKALRTVRDAVVATIPKWLSVAQ